MYKYFITLFLLFLPFTLQAQNAFLRFGGGFSTYTTDQDKMPLNNIQQYWSDTGKGGFGAVGYQFNPTLAVQVAVLYSQYPQIKPTAITLHTPDKTEDVRITPNLALQVNPFGNKVFSPYLRIGGHLQVLPEFDISGFGASAALGFQLRFSPQTAFFIETEHHYSLPKPTSASSLNNNSKADIAGIFAAGLRISLNGSSKNQGNVAPKIRKINSPTTAFVGDSVQLSVNLKKGTTPMEYIWDLGNGEQVQGETVNAVFTEVNDYVITLNVVNEFGVDKASKVINVQPRRRGNTDMPVPEDTIAPPVVNTIESPCVDLKIRTLTIPTRAFTTDELLFDAIIDGNRVLQTVWTLPNEESKSEKSFTKKLPEGRHLIKFYTANACSADQKSVQITVVAPKTCSLPTLNPIQFKLQDPLIMGDAYATLDGNLDAFLDCSNVCIQLKGSSGADEQNTTELLRNRLEAVADFYQFQGVNPKRIRMENTPVACTADSPKGCRKVETNAVSCSH
jgi:PKD domain/Outer membrane protein beta-barrel domain